MLDRYRMVLRLGATEMRYGLVIYWSNEDSAFLVEVPELPGCMADGATYEEAVANAQIVINEWIRKLRNPSAVRSPNQKENQLTSEP